MELKELLHELLLRVANDSQEVNVKHISKIGYQTTRNVNDINSNNLVGRNNNIKRVKEVVLNCNAQILTKKEFKSVIIVSDVDPL